MTMQDDMITVGSHALLSPLSTIRAALELVAADRIVDREQTRRILEIALANTERLVRLVSGILEIERLESPQARLQPARHSAAALILDAIEAVRPAAGEKHVRIETNRFDSMVVADGDRIVQVLTTLLANAVNRSPSYSTVRVTADAQVEEIIVRVHDEGPRIGAARLESMFERPTPARDSGDLALAICRTIVQQHGGKIRAESSPGAGNCFSFVLPRSGASSPVFETGGPSTAGPVIFACDDDAGTRELLRMLLHTKGFSVRTFASGSELAEQARRTPPSAILLDLFMPGLNGWETLALLKEHSRTRDVPVVVVSVLSKDDVGPVDLGVAGWVAKPLDEKRLLAAIEQACRSEHAVTA